DRNGVRSSSGIDRDGSIRVRTSDARPSCSTETRGGSGTIMFGRSSSNALLTSFAGDDTLTIGPGITVRGGGGSIGYYYGGGALVNEGTIRADASVGAGDFDYDHGFSSGYGSFPNVMIDTGGVTHP